MKSKFLVVVCAILVFAGVACLAAPIKTIDMPGSNAYYRFKMKFAEDMKLYIQGGEAKDAILQLQTDNGDDDEDNFQLIFDATDGGLDFVSWSTGSAVEVLTLSAVGVIGMTGALTTSGDITLDDGSGASPSLTFVDGTDETAVFTKADSGYLSVTTAAADGLNILVGSLKIGNGTPGQTINGEDAYVEGILEVDGAVTLDGTLKVAGSTALDDGVTDSPTLALIDAGDFTLVLQKLDAGGANIVNNEGVINFKFSGDADDYLEGSTNTGVPQLKTVGDCNFNMYSTGRFNFITQSDENDYLVVDSLTDEVYIDTDGACNLNILSSSGEILFGDENLTTTGTLDSGTITSTGNMQLDNGSGNSPTLFLLDEDDSVLALTKFDAGHAVILNNEGAVYIQANGDEDDNYSFTTVSDNPTWSVIGGGNSYEVITDGGSKFTTDGTNTFFTIADEGTTAQVTVNGDFTITGLKDALPSMFSSGYEIDSEWTQEADGTFRLSASNAGKQYLILLTGLTIGEELPSFRIVGQVESAGNAVVIDVDVRKVVKGVSDVTDSSIGAITTTSYTADTAVDIEKVFSAVEVVAIDTSYYALIGITTEANTDFAGIGIELDRNQK